jgi:hypothetical protein
MRWRDSRTFAAALIAAAGAAFVLASDDDRSQPAPARWRQHDIRRPRPQVVEPADSGIAARPPKDAILLFDGTNLDAWKPREGGGPARWKIVDGTMQTVPGAGAIETRAHFGDIQLHVEWAVPNPPHGVGQDRGNSGIFLMGEFELQVLDSYRADTYADGQAGAIYGQYPPLFNASRPPGQWQTYDVAFRRPRFDASGRLIEPARVTLFHNGILVQNNEEPFGPTAWLQGPPYDPRLARGGPIQLQDHDHPVRYRNVWLRKLPERPKPSAADIQRPRAVKLPQELLDRYAGSYRPKASRSDSPPWKVSRDGDHLTLLLPARTIALELVPISETQFDMPQTDGRFTFESDPGGKVTGVQFRIGDGDRTLMRVRP